MKRILSKAAHTMIELIIALMLVSVVVLGIVSIDVVLNSNSQDYGQRYLIKSETQTTLNHILNDAAMAVGTGLCVNGAATSPPPCAGAFVADQGILTQTTTPAMPANQFCIHQTPTGIGSDVWVCYTFNPATYQISYCNVAYNTSDGTGFRGAKGACAAAAQFLGTAYSITTPSAPSFAATPTTPPQLQFTISIENCLNDAAASCWNGTAALQDPANNPQAAVSGTISPQQEGTG